ncbi:transglycosylase SLT domain-containing protein [Paraconexibacter antarcticus]|uniref:transglycosylase SLT domain-containing protein n=1 Tax=Paraconexibacter antarcticus TaxID=2949664 RepID=UPI002665307C|nr:transglycosylase SLT domain-containing protein [Paraconexibacter antarcticus]
MRTAARPPSSSWGCSPRSSSGRSCSAGSRPGSADAATSSRPPTSRPWRPRGRSRRPTRTVFEPTEVDGLPNRNHLEREQYLALGRRAAERTARRNGVQQVAVTYPDGDRSPAPVRVRVRVLDDLTVSGEPTDVDPGPAGGVRADAELVPAGTLGYASGDAAQGEYPGPYAYRSGKPMRPDVAVAFDRLAAGAARAGITLYVVSGYRSNAEQAVLFAAHPDPKWVAPPGTSLHRLGTELDLGPATAYGWLDAHAGDYHFVRRYPWEPWHFGYTLNASSSARGATSVGVADRRTSLPSFVPARYAPLLARAAQRWNVSAALLAAQLYQESGFNPFARSGAGAQGIAQFMPGTAAQYGLIDPFDAPAAIEAQAHLMRDLLRQFGSVPLALAAYNAGPKRVQACGCIPPIPETQAYVAAILGLLHGAGDPSGAGAATLAVRLVR